MIIPSKVYDVLKWVCMIVLPAIATLWFTLGKVWGFPYLGEIEATIIAIDTFLGAILGVSTIQYNKIEKGVE
jgi:hypothetical protein